VEKALGLPVSILEPVPEDKEIRKDDLEQSENEEEPTVEKPKPRGASLTAEAGASPEGTSGTEAGATAEGTSATSETEVEEEPTKPKRGRPKKSMIMLKRGEGLLFSEEADADYDAPSLKEILKGMEVKTKYVAKKKKSTTRRLR